MTDEPLFESERTRSRADIATVLRSLATQLDGDGPVTLDADGRSATVTPPDRPVFEMEIERESDETSIELEIEWTERDDEDTSAIDAGTETAVESFGRFEIFRDRADEWRWRLVHRNGNIIATSGEGYTSKQNALKGMRSVMRNAPGADVVST